eukprot:5359768-Pleurochrysis_carterae.AAC.1
MVASRSRTIRRNETSVSGDSSRDLVASPDANLKSTTLRAAVPMAVAAAAAAAGVEAVVAKVVETVALPSGQAEALPLGVPSDGSRVVHTTAPAVSRQRSEEWIAGVVVALAVDLAVAHEADTGTDMCVQFIFALLFLASAVAVDAMTMEFEATADRSSRVEAKPVSVAPAPLRACAKSANVLCCTDWLSLRRGTAAIAAAAPAAVGACSGVGARASFALEAAASSHASFGLGP